MNKKSLSVCASVALGVGLALVANAATAAFYFEATTTSRGDGMGRNGQVMRVVGSIDGPKARIEFTEGAVGAGPFQAGSYMLTTNAGETLTLVNPAERTYTPIDLSAIFGFASAMLDAAGGLMQMQFKDVVNEKLGEGPGEEILGYDTTRYEFRTGYTMSVSVLGFQRENRSETHLEVWCTDEIDAEGFRVWLRPDRFRTGNAELDAVIEQQYQSLDCLPLRTNSTTTNTGSGNDNTMTSVTEVTTLREESGFDSSVFAIPDGYTEQALMPEMPEGFQLPTSGASGSEAEEPAEQPRIRLRDLLRGR